MVIKIRFALLVLVVLVATSSYCQDARIAHPFLWYSYYNPAHCGIDGLLKVDLGAQSNYTDIPSLFVDGHFALETGFGVKNVMVGIGLKVNNEYQGNGLLNVTTMQPTVSVNLGLLSKGRVKSYLGVGASFDVGSNHINMDKMVFADQLNPYYGKIVSRSAELGYIPQETLWSLDLSVGIFGQTTIESYGSYNMPILINYGFSVAHVLGSNNRSFYSNQSSIFAPDLYYRRFSAQFGYTHPYDVSNKIQMAFTGYGIYEYQGGSNDIQFGFLTNLNGIMAGVGVKVEKYNAYTVTNAMMHVSYGFKIDKYFGMRIAYTFETPVTQGGVHETSIHSLSIHLMIDHYGYTGRRNPCKYHPAPSDEAWYLMNNVYPTHGR